MKKAMLLVPFLPLVAACSGAATKESDTSSVEKDKSAATASVAAPAPFVPKGDLNDAQKATATEMHNLIFSRTVVQRIVEKCPSLSIDEGKMVADRERITETAKKNFDSSEEFMIAAGKDEQEAMGEQLRQFFASKNVAWDSSSDAYCGVGKALIGQATDGGQYLRAK